MEKEPVGKYTMPGIGFGTLGNVGDAGSALIEAALAEGYRYIDTSRYYGNEEAVGRALARSSVPRGDIWVTTKLLHPKTPPQPDLGLELEKSLRLLQTDYLNQRPLLDLMRARGLVLIAHSPLARGAVLNDPVLQEIAARRRLSVAQVVLRWLVQQERVVAIPGVLNVEQLRENLKVLDVTLTSDEMAAISALARGTRIVDPPHGPAWDSA